MIHIIDYNIGEGIDIEVWTTVVSNGLHIPRYKVSNYGRIINHKGEPLNPGINQDGYCKVGLYTDDGRKTRLMHRLVLESFSPRNKSYTHLVVNHKNLIKTDNFISNLEWMTALENTQHAKEHGHMIGIRGEANNFNKHSEETIIVACEMLEDGFSRDEVSLTTSIPKSYLYDLIYGKRWTHVTKEYDLSGHVISIFKGFDVETKDKIMKLSLEGLTAKPICDLLNIEPNSSHLQSIRRIKWKLNQSNVQRLS